MKPNIFDFATKELSQDAFLTWLLNWADPSNSDIDPKLHDCASEFVKELIKRKIPEFNEEITVVIAGRQWENIDIWVEVNNQYLLIIEDKTNTQRHSDQLLNYKKFATDWCIDNNYKEPICIYIKTGNESMASLNGVRKEGFYIYNRPDIVALLNSHPEIQNNIFNDFKLRINRLENENHLFKEKKIRDWVSSDWQGFFQLLEQEMEIADWKFVNNPNKGFWCAILDWAEWGIFPVYIQLEQAKLCFKISTHPDDLDFHNDISQAEIRDQFHHKLMEMARENDYKEIKRPGRFGNGKYMTVAVVEPQDWLGNEEDSINIQEIIRKLNLYKTFLSEVRLKKITTV
ncbi:PD-(D/E)XK nuclease superfamily protein [Pedobacter steynii]|uniref:PD-(D/E)XK nuclease superfamily protein n=1 Tax=Pedobacter steynii TaxID=430522 RepID=A0A1G9LH17_9SPHI|nr:PD-(D/E)XK nuclease family protein [Pedobacter steynii]NQX38843.1 PD-(D/E)XK nuclease family protein [Pedobacter steynii]SDL61127.1 PD-(D/E)XK nuclease superfamily protein [Pedobacter steynii]